MQEKVNDRSQLTRIKRLFW